MPITVTRDLPRLPDFAALSKLADAQEIRLTGSETGGAFSGRGADGSYAFTDAGVSGRFTAYGVSGEFRLEPGKATIEVIEKPFWLPESLLTQKLGEGLGAFCAALR